MTGAGAGDIRAFPSTVYGAAWRRRGNDLRSRVAEILRRAASLLGLEAELLSLADDDPPHVAGQLAALKWLAVERLRHDNPDRLTARELTRFVCDTQELALELHDYDIVTRTHRVAACGAGLARLHALPTSDKLLDRACEELVRSCGFGRAMISLVEGEVWRPLLASAQDSLPRWGVQWLGADIPLDEAPLERRVCREARAIRVFDASETAVPGIVSASKSSSYVVAPVPSSGEVVGLFHADYHPSSRRVDESDREMLAVFAEGFGRIYERTVLMDRLRVQRDEVREMLDAAGAAMHELCDAEIDLAGQARSDDSLLRTTASVMTTMSGNVGDLTPRETEVLALMVAGARNAEIAEKLVITQDTVKAHVKRILRKLGAVNRSQAIALCLGIPLDPLD